MQEIIRSAYSGQEQPSPLRRFPPAYVSSRQSATKIQKNTRNTGLKRAERTGLISSTAPRATPKLMRRWRIRQEACSGWISGWRNTAGGTIQERFLPRHSRISGDRIVRVEQGTRLIENEPAKYDRKTARPNRSLIVCSRGWNGIVSRGFAVSMRPDCWSRTDGVRRGAEAQPQTITNGNK